MNNDRFPKVICKEHDIAVREIYNNRVNPTYQFSKNLPTSVPAFKDIILPPVGTHTTPTGYNEYHTCFLCDQNTVGRPRQIDEHTPKTNDKLCSKCLQKCSPGIPHPCQNSQTNLVENISSTLLQMEPKVQDQVIHKLLRAKQDNAIPSTSKQNMSFHTAWSTATI